MVAVSRKVLMMIVKNEVMNKAMVKVIKDDEIVDYYYDPTVIFNLEQLIAITEAFNYYIMGFNCGLSFNNDREAVEVGQCFMIYNDLMAYINYGAEFKVSSADILENILSKIATVIDGVCVIYKDMLDDAFPESSVDMANDRADAIDKIKNLEISFGYIKCFLK